MTTPLDISTLSNAYQQGRVTPEVIVEQIFEKIRHRHHFNTWIHLLEEATVLENAQQLSRLSQSEKQSLPLYGIPFAVKDNVDVALLPTTAACPEYAYTPETSATVVDRLIKAGALLVGKTNMDQFATGLVGTRSPYGVCRNAFDETFISGGSSSGSAVAVAQGLVSFALGTDTAGSGRVPAGFNNIVGMKPTKGRLSTHGVVPACKSLDCVSIFALTSEDTWTVFNTAKGKDEYDEFSRTLPVTPKKSFHKNPELPFKFGIPEPKDLKFFGNNDYEKLYYQAVEQLEKLAGTKVMIDYAPFQETANLLYEGPWVAERYAALQEFIEAQRTILFPVTGTIIDNGKGYTAIDTFKAFYQLEALKKQTGKVWQDIDVLLLPTAGTIYTIDEVNQDPIQKNTNLGAYTNFVNLLDLCALAVPSGFQSGGLPFGVTLIAPAFQDEYLSWLGTRYHQTYNQQLGATEWPIPNAKLSISEGDLADQEFIEVAVFGLHLSGQKLNYQLLELGGQLVRSGKTASCYQMFAIGDKPESQKPGVIKANEGGRAIQLEVWKIPLMYLGDLLKQIAPPLGLGSVELANGDVIKGFICEGGFVLDHTTDITSFGGWIAYQKSL